MNIVKSDHRTYADAARRHLAQVRRGWAARAAARARAHRAAQDLASYTRPAEIEDLLATLDRGDGPEVEAMRHALQDNLTRYYRHNQAWAA